jgi:hypothetical protein
VEITLMMEAVISPETVVNIPDYSHLHDAISLFLFTE